MMMYQLGQLEFCRDPDASDSDADSDASFHTASGEDVRPVRQLWLQAGHLKALCIELLAIEQRIKDNPKNVFKARSLPAFPLALAVGTFCTAFPLSPCCWHPVVCNAAGVKSLR